MSRDQWQHIFGKRRRCGPVATLSRVMMAMKGRRALMTSRETSTKGGGGGRTNWSWSVRHLHDYNMRECSWTHSKTKNRGAMGES